MGGGPPGFPQDFSCPAVLWYRLSASGFDYRTVTFSGPAFLRCSSRLPLLFDGPQPRTSVEIRFGLFPLRSPLLGESMFLSLPPGTEMFQFPGCPPARLFCSSRGDRLSGGRVAPFGYPGIYACLRLPRAFRSLPRPSSAIGAMASTLRSYSLDPRMKFVEHFTRFSLSSFSFPVQFSRCVKATGFPLSLKTV